MSMERKQIANIRFDFQGCPVSARQKLKYRNCMFCSSFFMTICNRVNNEDNRRFTNVGLFVRDEWNQ
ncbi:MAG: hypothetical protein K0S61_2581 [Anaerocolumna sp.]|nr:hypothetical protein [Anaerocolumna sp.]